MEGPLQALTYAAVHEGCEHRGILVSAGMAGGQGAVVVLGTNPP